MKHNAINDRLESLRISNAGLESDNEQLEIEINRFNQLKAMLDQLRLELNEVKSKLADARTNHPSKLET